MNRSRADLLAMQDNGRPMTDQEQLEHLQSMRAEQMRLAKSWKSHELISKSHLENARKLHAEIKELKLQMTYARIDQIVGDEPIRQTDYDDPAEIITKYPTYDQLINGAKFTDQHRADLRAWWNEKYK